MQSDTLPQDRLRALYEVIARMNSVYELPDLLAFILDRVLEYSGGRRGYLLLAPQRIGLANEEIPLNDLKIAAIRGEGLEQVQTAEDVLEFVSRTVTRDVLQQREPRVIKDLHVDQRYVVSAGKESSFFKWRSILAIPLSIADQLIGLMYIEHPGKDAFPNPDMEFLSAFAAQSAVAIDRAQQSQRRIEELERLSEISRSLTRVLDLDQVLIQILNEVTRLLDVETGSVLLTDEKTNELVFRVSVQDGKPVSIARRLKIGQGVAGWVAENAQPLLVEDVHHEPRWFGEVEEKFHTRSVLCVPLMSAERVIGVVQSLNKKGPAGFTNRDLSLLTAFAATAAVAIENARLFAEARQVRELRALSEISAILGSTLELNAILQTGLVKALDVLNVEAGAVSLLDAESGELIMAATHGWRRNSVPVGTHIPAGQGLSGLVISSGEVLITSNVQNDQRVAVQTFRDEGIQAMVMLPMRSGGQAVGILSVISYVPHTFTSEEVRVLETIAGMFSAAVSNARLYDRVLSNLRQLSYLYEVGGALTASLDVENVLQIIMEGMTSLIGVERASIFLVNESTNELILEYSFGGKESIRLPAPWPGIAGWIATQGEPIIVNNVREDSRFLSSIDAATQFATRSILGAPLKVDNSIIGAIEMLNKHHGAFTTQDRDLLVGFSKWAAIALHNAQLYQELDEAKDRLASAEAVAVMSDMALNLTHRLNNRISAARVNATRIQTKCVDELQNQYLAQKIEQIVNVTGESLNIIRRIRQPFEMAELEPVQLETCIRKALTHFQIEPGIKVIEEFPAVAAPVAANPEKIIETFSHVIGNALDAMQGNGELRLTLRQRSDRLVEVNVSDSGVGIPPETLDHIFEPFFTTKEGRGLGLGLWLTRMYISRLGGQVKMESAPGLGSTVSIRLPAVSEKGGIPHEGAGS